MKTGLNKYSYALIFLTIFFVFSHPALAAAWAVAPDEFYPGTPPTISEISQFKLDGQTLLEENSINAQDTVVFKATLNDSDNDQIKLQIELKEYNQSFNEQDLLESDYVNSGSEATVTRYGLIDGQYKWRARAVDFYGLASNWQEFGTAGNTDFEVKIVPLYTQGLSSYPSEEKTRTWFNLPYADGHAGCGNYISNCGCAITSSVMIARYHGFESDVDNSDVNPKNINDWLNNHSGYWPRGDLEWEKVPDYVNKDLFSFPRLRYAGAVAFKDTNTLNSYLKRLIPDPVVLKVMVWSQKLNKDVPHFIVADGKLSNTYTVKDPAFYNTKYLAQAKSFYVYNYNNDFKELRLYELDDISNPHGVDGISVNLASPAELLITDPQGRKLGKDPVSGTSYNEIPDGSYYLGGIGDPSDESMAFVEESKFIWIPEPLNGNYDIKIIGTDSGQYHLYLDNKDTNGSSTINSFSGITQVGLISGYSLDYTNVPGTPIEIERVVTIPDTIKDVEISYNLGWITKKIVKDILIAKLKVAQQLQEQKEKQLRHKEKYEEIMNKVIAKILNLFIKEISFYQKKGYINDEASKLLIDDAQYIIGHLLK